MSPSHFHLFGIALSIDGTELADEFASVFGQRTEVRGLRTESLRVRVDSYSVLSPQSSVLLSIEGDNLEDPAAFLAGFSSPDIPLRLGDEPGTVRIGDDPEPVFRFDGARCEVRRVPHWARIVSHMLFLRMIRLRPDLLFFHAATVGIGGRGILIVGPKGHGKTTTSLALASRGHAFLGDETAIYEPSTALLHPFHRPVGIKPGPAASAVVAKIGDLAMPAEGILRIAAERVVPRANGDAVPLHAVVFLQGFADETRLEAVTAGRDELAQMQPLASSLGAGAASMRVFAMVRLLGSTKCFKLWPSNPDMTAEYLERVLTP